MQLRSAESIARAAMRAELEDTHSAVSVLTARLEDTAARLEARLKVQLSREGEAGGEAARREEGLAALRTELVETARLSPIPSPCTQSTRAEWRRCHRAACMARSYQEHHRSVRVGP